jgi:hypothetical protein
MWFIPTDKILGYHDDGTPVVMTDLGVADGVELTLQEGASDGLV